MKRLLYIIQAVLLLVVGSTSAAYAQTIDYTTLPKFFTATDGTEWTSELLTFEEAIEGFRITVFETNTASGKYNGYPFVTLAELDITDADGNNVPYTATTNSLAANDGGGLAALQDNDNTTHYHSAYNYNVSISPSNYVYIEVKFNEPQSAFTYRQVRRSNRYNFPINFAFSALGVTVNPPFNPTNPPEPQENIYRAVTVSASPADVAYTSGSGKFTEGSKTTIRYSRRNSNYTFSHWTLNGEEYSTSSSFTYTMGNTEAAFVAHFDFTPSSPSEPSSSDEYKLYIESNNPNACSFNTTSGNWVEFETWVTVTAYVNQGYEFLGWYNGTTLVSSSSSFQYQMPANNVTLTAKFIYNPTNPAEPDNDDSQTDIQTTAKGDVNKDSMVNVGDVVTAVNRILGSDTDNNLCDINGDNTVNVSDLVEIINLILAQ